MTSSPSFAAIDHRLHDHVVGLVLDQGPQELEWLARRARRDLRDARIDEQAIIDVVEPSAVLVPRTDATIDHALAVLEGNVLTHRVRAPLRGRNDLWLGPGVQPLLNVAAFRPLTLAGGGEVTRAEPGYDALIGPHGWLPELDRYELIGLRVVHQRLVVERVAEDELPPPEQQLRVRQMLAAIYTGPPFYEASGGDLTVRPGLLAHTISMALLEDPQLFATAYPPLDELLHNPLGRDMDLAHWRSVALGQQVETVGFWLDGIPAALHIELVARARLYGMTDAQFIVAMLSTLAWRTPFAEDMEPFDDWDPEVEPRARIAPLRLAPDGRD